MVMESVVESVIDPVVEVAELMAVAHRRQMRSRIVVRSRLSGARMMSRSAMVA